MRGLFKSGIIMLLSLLSLSLWGQTTKKDVEMGSPATQKFTEVETQVGEGLPDLVSAIQTAVQQMKKGKLEESRASIDHAKVEFEKIMKFIGEDPYYTEIEGNFINIDNALKKSEDALDQGKKKIAMQQISKAYRLIKALAGSPTLKMTAAMISVDMASEQIGKKNYTSAGIFLNRALDSLGKIENDPNIDLSEVNKLKNEIVIVHQQVILGKMADQQPVKSIYNKLAIANTNTLYQYYDMWARTDVSWDNY